MLHEGEHKKLPAKVVAVENTDAAHRCRYSSSSLPTSPPLPVSAHQEHLWVEYPPRFAYLKVVDNCDQPWTEPSPVLIAPRRRCPASRLHIELA